MIGLRSSAALLVAVFSGEARAQVALESLQGTTSLAGEWRYRAGDDPTWASPDLDDTT